MSKMIFMKYLPVVMPKLVPKMKEQNLLKYITFDISIITLVYLFIYLFRKRSIAYLRNYKLKGFLTIFLPQSNVYFYR